MGIRGVANAAKTGRAQKLAFGRFLIEARGLVLGPEQLAEISGEPHKAHVVRLARSTLHEEVSLTEHDLVWVGFCCVVES